MDPSSAEIARRVAARALAYKRGEVSWDAFMGEFGELAGADDIDDRISELVSEIEHEPQRGGWLGLNEKQWQAYEQRIYQLIEELGT